MSILKMALIGFGIMVVVLGLLKVLLSWTAYKIVLSVIVAIVVLVARFLWTSEQTI